MSGHTPGPWEVDSESSNDGEAEVVIGAGRTICWTADTLMDDEEAVITDEDRANGRLIAAAPELLTGLQAAVESLVELAQYEEAAKDKVATGWFDNAVKAIAKAKGVLNERP